MDVSDATMMVGKCLIAEANDNDVTYIAVSVVSTLLQVFGL